VETTTSLAKPLRLAFVVKAYWRVQVIEGTERGVSTTKEMSRKGAERVLPQALTVLATGLLGELADDKGMIGRLLAIWTSAWRGILGFSKSLEGAIGPGPNRSFDFTPSLRCASRSS